MTFCHILTFHYLCKYEPKSHDTCVLTLGTHWVYMWPNHIECYSDDELLGLRTNAKTQDYRLKVNIAYNAGLCGWFTEIEKMLTGHWRWITDIRLILIRHWRQFQCNVCSKRTPTNTLQFYLKKIQYEIYNMKWNTPPLQYEMQFSLNDRIRRPLKIVFDLFGVPYGPGLYN